MNINIGNKRQDKIKKNRLKDILCTAVNMMTFVIVIALLLIVSYWLEQY